MVKSVNVSSYAGTPPKPDTARAIANGPLYDRNAVLLAVNATRVRPWTSECIKWAQKLEFELEDLCQLIRDTLEIGKYRNSEWCQNQPGGPWAACDAYIVHRKEWIPVAHKYFVVEYYVKFGLSKSGSVVLLVSCHLPRG